MWTTYLYHSAAIFFIFPVRKYDYCIESQYIKGASLFYFQPRFGNIVLYMLGKKQDGSCVIMIYTRKIVITFLEPWLLHLSHIVLSPLGCYPLQTVKTWRHHGRRLNPEVSPGRWRVEWYHRSIRVRPTRGPGAGRDDDSCVALLQDLELVVGWAGVFLQDRWSTVTALAKVQSIWAAMVCANPVGAPPHPHIPL